MTTALLFEAGGQQYGLDVRQIVEVVPAVHLRSIPGVAAYIAGLFHYRDTIVPVIDISRLLTGSDAAKRFSTRLVLVHYPDATKRERVLGLLVEDVVQGLVENLGELMAPGIATPESPFLGKIASTGDSMIQFLRVEDLLPEDLRTRLFAED